MGADGLIVQYVFLAVLRTAEPRFPSVPLSDTGIYLLVIYQSLVVLSVLSHARAATSDPGILTDDVAPSHVPEPRICKCCDGRWKPPRAHHCTTCDRCIFRMDHHCTWINNCVGFSNQKLFILFLVYATLTSLLTLVLLVWRSLHWLWNDADAAGVIEHTVLLCVVAGAAFSLGAIVFMGDFLKEQLIGVQSNSTVVESYMGTCGATSTFATQFRAVFGEHWWTWPLPTRATIEADYAEPVFPIGRQGKFTAEEYEYLGIAGDEDETRATSHFSRASGLASRDNSGYSPAGSPERHRSRADTPPPRQRTRGNQTILID